MESALLPCEEACLSAEAYPGRRRSPRTEALLVGALCMVFGGIIGRHMAPQTAQWMLAGAGFYAAWQPPVESGSLGGPSQMTLAPPPANSSATYYLPSDLGVHHHTVSGAACPTPFLC